MSFLQRIPLRVPSTEDSIVCPFYRRLHCMSLLQRIPLYVRSTEASFFRKEDWSGSLYKADSLYGDLKVKVLSLKMVNEALVSF